MVWSFFLIFDFMRRRVSFLVMFVFLLRCRFMLLLVRAEAENAEAGGAAHHPFIGRRVPEGSRQVEPGETKLTSNQWAEPACTEGGSRLSTSRCSSPLSHPAGTASGARAPRDASGHSGEPRGVDFFIWQTLLEQEPARR